MLAILQCTFKTNCWSYVLRFLSILSYLLDNNVLLCLNITEINFKFIFVQFSSTFQALTRISYFSRTFQVPLKLIFQFKHFSRVSSTCTNPEYCMYFRNYTSWLSRPFSLCLVQVLSQWGMYWIIHNLHQVCGRSGCVVKSPTDNLALSVGEKREYVENCYQTQASNLRCKRWAYSAAKNFIVIYRKTSVVS